MYYFYSPTPAALKLDGALTGDVSRNILPVDKKFTVAEIIPLDGKCPIAFDITKPSLCKNVSVLNTLNDTFIRVLYFPQESLPYKVIAYAEKYINGNKFSVTAVSDGRLRLITSTTSNVDVLEIPFAPNEIKIESANKNGESFVYIFLTGNAINTLIVYEIYSLDLRFEKAIDSFNSDSHLHIKQCLSDSKKHVITSTWEEGKTFKCTRYEVAATLEKTFPDDMKGMLFFEEMRVKGDLKEYLTPEMYQRQKSLYSFIGEICEIIPLPVADEYLLLYNDKMKVFKLCFSNGLICNINEID